MWSIRKINKIGKATYYIQKGVEFFMNTLLLFFALPIAVIIISIALQKILRNPLLVAGIIFAIFLIVTFVIGDLNILIATIVYTIISYVTALVTSLICRFLKNGIHNNLGACCNSCNNSNNNGCNNQNNNNNDDDDSEVCGANGITARINVIPNNSGTSGNINGCYRRR